MSMFAKAGQVVAAAAALTVGGRAETSVEHEVLSALANTNSAAASLEALHAEGGHLEYSADAQQGEGPKPASGSAKQDPVKQEKPAEKESKGPQDGKKDEPGKQEPAKPHSSSAAELLRSAGGKKAAEQGAKPEAVPQNPATQPTGPATKPAEKPATPETGAANPAAAKPQEPAPGATQDKPAAGAAPQQGPAGAAQGPETKPTSQPAALQGKVDPALQYLNMTPDEIAKLSPEALQKAIVTIEKSNAEIREQTEAASRSIEVKQRIVDALVSARVDNGDGKVTYDVRAQNEALKALNEELKSKQQELKERAKELDALKQAQDNAPKAGLPAPIRELVQSLNAERESFKAELGGTTTDLSRRKDEVLRGFTEQVQNFNRESGIIDLRRLWVDVPDPNDPKNPVRQIVDKVIVDPAKNPKFAELIAAGTRPLTEPEIDKIVRGEQALPAAVPLGTSEELAGKLIEALGANMEVKGSREAAAAAEKAQTEFIGTAIPKDAQGAMVRTLVTKIGNDAASIEREERRLQKLGNTLGSGDPNQLTPWQETQLQFAGDFYRLQIENGRRARDNARQEAESELDRGQRKGEELLNDARRKRDEGPLPGGIIKIGG